MLSALIIHSAFWWVIFESVGANVCCPYHTVSTEASSPWPAVGGSWEWRGIFDGGVGLTQEERPGEDFQLVYKR